MSPPRAPKVRARRFASDRVPEDVYRESAQQVGVALRMMFERHGAALQRDAADRVGMSESQLCRILSGGLHERGARTDTLARIAWHFDSRLVVDFEPENTPPPPAESDDRLKQVIGAITKLQLRLRRVGRDVAADELNPIVALATGKDPTKI